MASAKRALPAGAAATAAAASWFPGHMAAALRQMRAILKGVDLVVDVRDARAPAATAPAPPLEALLRNRARPRLVVLAKADLAPAGAVRRAARAIEARERARAQAPVRVVASAAAASTAGMATGPLLRAAAALLRSRAARLSPSSPESSSAAGVVMVVGAPNVGKSSLINAMRRAAVAAGAGGGPLSSAAAPAAPSPLARRAKVGDAPGVTRHLSGFLLPLPLVDAAAAAGNEGADASKEAAAGAAAAAAGQHGYFDARRQAAESASAPSSSTTTITAHVLDTPGISPPAVRSERDARVLALLGCLRQGAVSEERQAAHLLALFRRSPRARRELQGAARRLKAQERRREGPAADGRRGSSGGGGGGAGAGGGGLTEKARRDALVACRALLSLSSLPQPPPGRGSRHLAGHPPGRRRSGDENEAWHPALEEEEDEGQGHDEASASASAVLADAAALAEALGADAGARDPSGAAGALGRALSAFRSGALGRYSLEDDDDDEEEEEGGDDDDDDGRRNRRDQREGTPGFDV